MGAAKLPNAMDSKWTVLNGITKGSVHLMTLAEFTIGRSSECELVISEDPKVSRKHALVKIQTGGYEISSLSENNPVTVNGRDVESSPLNPGDVVKFGETEMRFDLAPARPDLPPRPMTPGEIEIAQPTYASYPTNYGSRPPPQRPRPRPAPLTTSNGEDNSKRFLIYGAVLLIGFWLFSGSPQKKKDVDIRTEQQIQADIEAAQKLKEVEEQKKMKRQDGSLTATQAQENYVRGFRDYKKGQYERSLVSFQACLSLNPEHALCNRYLRLAQRRFNELVQYQIVLGRKYRDQNQFKLCRSAFRNVMVMVKDANSAIYKEAKANYEACNSLVEGRF